MRVHCKRTLGSFDQKDFFCGDQNRDHIHCFAIKWPCSFLYPSKLKYPWDGDDVRNALDVKVVKVSLHPFPIQKWTVPTEQNISLFDQFIDQNVFKIHSWVEIRMSRSLSSPDREDGANFYCPGRKSSRVHSEEKSHRAIITHGQFQNSFQRSIRWQFFKTLKKSRNENKLGEKKVFA